MSIVESATQAVPIRNDLAAGATALATTAKGGALAGGVTPTLTPIKNMVRRKKRTGLGILLSALLCIGLPAAVAGYYFFVIASDQFVSEFKFSVRGAERVCERRIIRAESQSAVTATAPSTSMLA